MTKQAEDRLARDMARLLKTLATLPHRRIGVNGAGKLAHLQPLLRELHAKGLSLGETVAFLKKHAHLTVSRNGVHYWLKRGNRHDL